MKKTVPYITGDDYNKLEKTIVILIADFNIKGLEEVDRLRKRNNNYIIISF